MIALLNCSISLSGSEPQQSSTGELVEQVDSVLIAYDDLRTVNSKLIELEYQKEINKKLNDIVDNDSKIISSYETLNKNLSKDCSKYIRQRNICIGVAAVTTIVSIILIAK